MFGLPEALIVAAVAAQFVVVVGLVYGGMYLMRRHVFNRH
jgi:hypothetical protein